MNLCAKPAFSAPPLVLSLIFFSILFPGSAIARDWKALKPAGYVSDFAGVVDASSKAELEAYCATVEKATGAQLAFVTVQTLEGEAIEDVANDIFRGFGIGSKGKDNGVLLLLVAGDRRFRLEVGHGLEPILPDGLDGQILLEMRPALRQGEFGQALLYAAQRIGTILGQDKGVAVAPPSGATYTRPRIRERPMHSIPWPLILGGLAVLFLFSRGSGRGGGGGSGFLTGMLLGGLMGGGRRYNGGGGGYSGFYAPSSMNKDLDQLLTRLFKALGERLVSVVLYGSAAHGQQDATFSDLNVLCVLTKIGSDELAASEAVFRWWHGLGHPSPLLLTKHEVETSSDCFPMEFTDIQKHHQILFGKDVASGLSVDRTYYRAQVERELRAKLLRLRTKAAPILSGKEELANLMAESLSTFCVLFRHALALHGVEAGPGKREIIVACQERFGLRPEPFLQLLDAREKKLSLAKLDSPVLFAAYLRELSNMVDVVDRLHE